VRSWVDHNDVVLGAELPFRIQRRPDDELAIIKGLHGMMKMATAAAAVAADAADMRRLLL